MKIAVVASPVSPLRPAQLGGAQSLVSDLAAGLAQRGHDVSLHCAEGSEVPGVRLVTVPLPADAAAALVMPAGRSPQPSPGVGIAIAAMFEAIAAGSVDAISQHAFDAEAFRAGRVLPILHTVHLPPLVPEIVDALKPVGPMRLATVSKSCQRDWAGAGIEIGRVLRNGVADMEVSVDAPEHCALVAGRISPEKGIEDALVAARLAGIGVRVAGSAYDPGYHPDLSSAEFVGSLPRHELRQLMARSAVTICAVRWDEPFGLVAAEAQMSGCPVAGYARGGLPEVVEDGVSGILVPPDDLEALARAIRECTLLDRSRVRASARRRLGLDAALDRYEQALGEVAS